MKYFAWDEVKNELLKLEREISFDDIQVAIDDGQLLDIIDHPNQEKYT